jgi:phage N-6-adenine-methyltransferase
MWEAWGMNKNDREAMFSTGKNDWETPDWLFNVLNKIYKFDIDVCADYSNAKCDIHFGLGEDGFFVDALKMDWRGACWMNPPYSEPEHPCNKTKDGEYVCTKKRCKERGYHVDEYVPGCIDFVEKAFLESKKEGLFFGGRRCGILALLPVRTDTKLYHKFIDQKADVIFLPGRLKFKGAKSGAPFPSMLVGWPLGYGKRILEEGVDFNSERLRGG